MEKETIMRMLQTRNGVPILMGAPGTGKSSFGRQVAYELGMKLFNEPLQYIDLRLSQMEETDVGLFPKDRGDYLGVLVPEFAVMANQKPTLIHFEELNRATREVRNATLQILCERAIGHNHKFNDNVFMMASGNLGEADGTDVEELDAATNNRLIHMQWQLTIPQWKEAFADKHVHPTIVEFLEANPQYFQRRNEQESAWASARSWTMFSDFVGKDSEGEWADDKDLHRDASHVGHCYVGTSITRFITFMTDRVTLGMDTIIQGFDKCKKRLDKLGRARRNELVMQLKAMKLDDMTVKELKEVEKFVAWLEPDEMVGYLSYLLDKDDSDAAARLIAPHHDKLSGLMNN